MLIPVDGTHGYTETLAGEYPSNYIFSTDFNGRMVLSTSKPGGNATYTAQGDSYNDQRVTSLGTKTYCTTCPSGKTCYCNKWSFGCEQYKKSLNQTICVKYNTYCEKYYYYNTQNNWSEAENVSVGSPAIKTIRTSGNAAPANVTANSFVHEDMRNSSHGITWENSNSSFSWSFTEPRVNVHYGGAGEAGEMRHLTFANLEGTLFLRPGRNNNGQTINTVVTTTNLDGNTIVEAASHGTPGVADETGWYTLREAGDKISQNPAYPTQDVLNRTKPNNSQFRKYISRLNATAVYGQGGLWHCDRQEQEDGSEVNSCPGYAGTGAFPLITDYKDFKNKLVLRNNQSYATRIGGAQQYIEEFDPPQMNFNDILDANGNMKCPEDLENPNAGNMDELQYCRATNLGNRDGAVIIIW